MITKIFNEEILNLIFHSVANGIVITNAEAEIIWANKGFTNLTGYTFEEVKGKNPRILKSNLHNNKFYKKMWDTISNGEVWRGEVVNKRKDGNLYYEEMTITPVKNEKINYYIAIKNDITAKKNAEMELKKEQELVKSVMRTVPIPLSISDLDGNIIDVNKAWENTVGWTRKEAIERGSENLNLWIDKEKRQEVLKRIQEEGKIENLEIPVKRKDGKILDLLFWGILGEDYLFTSALDITERKKEEERYKMVLNNAYDGINICEIDKKTEKRTLIFCNDRYVELSGFTRKELFDCENLNDLRSRFQYNKEEIDGLNKKIHGISSWNRPDRKENYYEYTACLCDFEDKIQIFGIDRDITERIKTQKKLKEIENKLLSIVDVVFIVIWAIDKNGIFTLSEGRGLETLGFKSGEVVGRSIFDVYKGNESLKIIIDRCLNGEQFDADVIINDSTWNTRYVPIKDKDGDVIGASGISIDISEKVKIKNQLEIFTKQLKANNRILKAKNEELNYFAHIATHDLREPLRKIQLYVDSLKDDLETRQLSENSKQDMDFITESVSQMDQTLTDLLIFSRATKQTLIKESVNINECVSKAIKTLEPMILKSGVEIEICNLGSTKCDNTMITQVFQNLIGNAIKFNDKQNPKIKIYTKQSRAKNQVFIVEDNGIGIEKEFINQIFAPFKKLHSTDIYPGTGIGLSICKKIIEKHDGKIWVESKINKGSRFKFVLRGD